MTGTSGTADTECPFGYSHQLTRLDQSWSAARDDAGNPRQAAWICFDCSRLHEEDVYLGWGDDGRLIRLWRA